MKSRQGVIVRELQSDLSAAAIANRQAAQVAHSSWATYWFSVILHNFILLLSALNTIQNALKRPATFSSFFWW